MSDEILARFNKCAVEEFGVDEAKLTPTANFTDDLEADSLDLAAFVMALEGEFGVSIEEEELEGIETVGAAYDLLVAKLG